MITFRKKNDNLNEIFVRDEVLVKKLGMTEWMMEFLSICGFSIFKEAAIKAKESDF